MTIQRAPLGGIKIVSASYGRNCGALKDNQLLRLQEACEGKMICEWMFGHDMIGDPAKDCDKTFEAKYTCVTDAGGNTSGSRLCVRGRW